MHGSLIDRASGEARPVAALLTDILDLIWEDAEALGCSEQAAAAQMILREGTSADRQLAVYNAHLEQGGDREGALRAVVNWLAYTTAAPAKIAVGAGL